MHVQTDKLVVLFICLLVWAGRGSSEEGDDLEETVSILEELYTVVEWEAQAPAPSPAAPPAAGVHDKHEGISKVKPVKAKATQAQDLEPKSPLAGGTREATISLRFSTLSYSEVESNPALRRRLEEDIVINLSEFTQVDPKYIRILEILEGSVIIKTTISFPEAVPTSRARQLVQQATSSPEVVFTSGGFASGGDFRVPEVAIDSMGDLFGPPPPPSAVSTQQPPWISVEEGTSSHHRPGSSAQPERRDREEKPKREKFPVLLAVVAGSACTVAGVAVIGVMVMCRRKQRHRACMYAEF